MLGHEVAYDSDADNLFLKMDEHHHRLSVHPGDVEDVAFVGWEVGSAANMQAVAAQLDAADIEVIAAKPELAADRRVVDFVQLHRSAQRGADGAALRARGRVLAAVPAAAADHRLQDRATRASATS